jgi:mercuric reductase
VRYPAASPSADRYDVVTIGAGSAAFAAGIRATNLGARVALVERDTVGGTCVNVGCIPSKHLLAASEHYFSAGHHPFPGVAPAHDRVDMPALVAKKDDVVAALRSEKYVEVAEQNGFSILRGHARFTGPDAIDVDGRQIRAGAFLVATGSRPSVPPIEGLADSGYLTSTTAMELEAVPGSMLVIGGNYVGLELGQLFANLGTKVTIIEALGRLAPSEEPEVSQSITSVLAERGVEVVTAATVVHAGSGERKSLVVRVGGAERRFEGDEILVATGRRPVLEGLNLGAAGVDLDAAGRLVLDEELRTTNPRVFAAGDVTGAPQFVYVAAAQGTVAADNAVGSAGRTMEYRALPRVTFTQPNLAAVGLTEEEARRAGLEVVSHTLELDHVPRARVNLDTGGAIKIVAERRGGRVVGVHMAAANAGDAILAAVYAVKFGLSVRDLAETWAPYLTMAEGIKLAAQSFTTEPAKLSCCAI